MSAILSVEKLGFVWNTADPFLFSVHHLDAYPKGNGKLGPAASLAGRNLGQDFDDRNGWRMYHGLQIPGFPSHPHWGFETVTLVRTGVVDHFDSLGATGRFGGGDTQWMTAGRGVQHSEMFPLVDEQGDNPLELFQIWLNLPAADKMVPPHYKMLWSEEIPQVVSADAKGRKTRVTVVAGELDGQRPPAPPPNSWAADPANDVAIWTLQMEAGAVWTLPRAKAGTNRMLYAFDGGLAVDGRAVHTGTGVKLKPTAAVELAAGLDPVELVLLQGRPIDEPVAKYGPFVMNTQTEIRQAFTDYQRTRFGGWPWPDDAPAHPADVGRFARYADGSEERPA